MCLEGQALINRDDLRGIANALRKAHRVNISFEKRASDLDSIDLILDTEIARYKLLSADGQFPDYQKLIPTEFNTVAHFDTIEMRKAIASLKVLADSKSYPIDLWLDDNTLMLANSEDKGQVTIPADIEGKSVKVRIDGQYLAQALKACGGMVDFKLTNAYSPTLFTVDGYQLVVMPMMTTETSESQKRDREQVQPTEPEASEPKRKHKAKEPVAV